MSNLPFFPGTSVFAMMREDATDNDTRCTLDWCQNNAERFMAMSDDELAEIKDEIRSAMENPASELAWGALNTLLYQANMVLNGPYAASRKNLVSR